MAGDDAAPEVDPSGPELEGREANGADELETCEAKGAARSGPEPWEPSGADEVANEPCDEGRGGCAGSGGAGEE